MSGERASDLSIGSWSEDPPVSPKSAFPAPSAPTQGNSRWPPKLGFRPPNLSNFAPISEQFSDGEEVCRETPTFSFTESSQGRQLRSATKRERLAQAMTTEPSQAPGTGASDGGVVQESNDSGETAQQPPLSSTPPRRMRNIDDCIEDLLVEPRHDLERLEHKDGDTWIFIRAPSREPEYTDAMYHAICNYYKTPLTASSSVLEDSQSELILSQLKNPTKQYRIVRRFGVKNDMQKHGIRYVVDLTPPVEGDDAVELTQELSCPPGVLKWFHESCAFHVSNNMVAGTEEFTLIARGKKTVEDGQARPDISAIGPTGMHDYTPLRHRAAIERVLLALHGHNPQLNSAPKMYTTVMTAVKHLKIPAYCLTSNLTDYVVTWLRAVPNSAFIGLHPDITLKVADCLEVAHLCQDVFAILVGENALRMVSQYNVLLPRKADYSIHNRPISPVDEIWETRLQYARNALVERVNGLFFDQLVGGGMEWVERLPCVSAVRKKQNEHYMLMFRDWIERLKDFAKGAIYCILLGHYTQLPLARDWTKAEKEVSSWMTNVYSALTSKERIFTRNFWLSLSRIRLDSDAEAFNSKVNSGSSSVFTTDSAEYTALLKAGVFKEVTGRSILRRAWEMRSENLKPDASDAEAQTEGVPPQFARLPVGTPWYKFAPGVANEAGIAHDSPSSPQKPGLAIRNVGAMEQFPGRSAKVALASSSDVNRLIITEIFEGWKSKTLNFRPVAKRDIAEFEFSDFCDDLEHFLVQFASQLLQQPNSDSLDQHQIDLVLCLTDNETKYLPLWAGGWDDGTNGVYNEEAPAIPEEEGFGPARDGLRRNFPDGEGDADFDGASTTLGAPTLATSRMVNDGHSVIMDRRQVYADDEVESAKYRSGASEAGTEGSWVEAGRDDISISTTSELANDLSRAGLNSLSTASSVAEVVEMSEVDPIEESAAQSEAESSLNLDSDREFDFEGASEGSEFDFMDTAQPPEASSTTRKRKSREFDEDSVSAWLRNESGHDGGIIKYKEPPKSPLTFDRD